MKHTQIQTLLVFLHRAVYINIVIREITSPRSDPYLNLFDSKDKYLYHGFKRFVQMSPIISDSQIHS